MHLAAISITPLGLHVGVLCNSCSGIQTSVTYYQGFTEYLPCSLKNVYGVYLFTL